MGDADDRERRVQLAGRGRVDVARLPRVVDLSQLVGAAPALRQQLNGARKHDEVGQHLTDDEPRGGHGQSSDVAVPEHVDVESSRVTQSVDADPVRCGQVLSERVDPDDVDVEKTEDYEESGNDAVSSSELADGRQPLRTLVNARRLGSHHHRQPRAQMNSQVRHVRVDLHVEQQSLDKMSLHYHTLSAAKCSRLIDKGKGKGFPYSLPSIGSGADPSVHAVSPQVT